MKKFMSILAIASMVVAFASCKSNTQEPATEEMVVEETPVMVEETPVSDTTAVVSEAVQAN